MDSRTGNKPLGSMVRETISAACVTVKVWVIPTPLTLTYPVLGRGSVLAKVVNVKLPLLVPLLLLMIIQSGRSTVHGIFDITFTTRC